MSESPSPSPDLSLPGALGRRTRRATAAAATVAARRRLHAALTATDGYRGGLPAERDSAKRSRSAALAAARLEARQAWCDRRGRPIDLPLLLRQRRPDGRPRWTIVDPTISLEARRNGTFDRDGSIMIGTRWVKFFDYDNPENLREAFAPNGIPPLPPAARRLVTDRVLRRRAAWVGLLFEPAGWTEVRPDPAIVVEWKALPGRYYALMVWGPDFPRIMEFVS